MKFLKIRTFVFTALAVAISTLAITAPLTSHMVLADSVSDAQQGLADTGTAPAQSVPNLIQDVISILSYIIGAVSVIMIIIGGFRYVVSAGDSGSITSAKNTIIYAIVGLVIAIFAQVIVRFVLGKF
jgi:hypothetical protein